MTERLLTNLSENVDQKKILERDYMYGLLSCLEPLKNPADLAQIIMLLLLLLLFVGTCCLAPMEENVDVICMYYLAKSQRPRGKGK